jgi:hypothetical protein
MIMINVFNEYKGLLDKLISFLKTLSLKDWNRSTILPEWKVADIAVHLLSGCIRKCSSVMNYQSGIKKYSEPQTYSSIVKMINENNEKWVNILRDLNRELIIELLNENYSRLILKFSKLDPEDESVHSVAWAGEDISKNWFDTAREYTELWHHQMQIREAFNDFEILDDYYYYKVIKTFFAALPNHFKKLNREVSYNLLIKIKDMKNGEWILVKNTEGLVVSNEPENYADNFVIIEKNDAWKIFTKAVTYDTAKSLVNYSGKEDICLHLLKMACIMI